MQVNNVHLRPFSPTYIESVIALLQLVSRFEPEPSEALEYAKRFECMDNCYSFVAIHEGRVIGFGSIFMLNRVRGGCSAVIEDLVVAQDMQGHGVGRALLEKLLEQARGKGCFKVSLEAADSALSFYEACGFSRAGQSMKINL
ncbi:GNAT family N-acetyltransferase [Leeia aquatica]|uniref:GNAT family N-acetyltransferase n=1 Tax=Leeia aquatica TaxID=2725557 RepID=A0A847SCX9_9NEIS|nr:GNAT family N-acetyltransferase [Leeia aquatica]